MVLCVHLFPTSQQIQVQEYKDRCPTLQQNYGCSSDDA